MHHPNARPHLELPEPVGALVEEELVEAPFAHLRLPPGLLGGSYLLAGTTTRRGNSPGGGGVAQDFRLFGSAPAGEVLGRWEALLHLPGVTGAVHSRQIHGADVRFHRDPGPGLHITPPGDGHATRTLGLLLTVGLADCVPVFLSVDGGKGIALLHAGWRGVAAGILERGIRLLGERLDVAPEAISLHLGPGICAACYEVGPEVHRGLGIPEPKGPALLDLPGVLASRGVEAGVEEGRVTRSTHCTRCGPAPLFSHRRGDVGRHIAFLALVDPISSPPRDQGG